MEFLALSEQGLKTSKHREKIHCLWIKLISKDTIQCFVHCCLVLLVYHQLGNNAKYALKPGWYHTKIQVIPRLSQIALESQVGLSHQFRFLIKKQCVCTPAYVDSMISHLDRSLPPILCERKNYSKEKHELPLTFPQIKFNCCSNN